MNLTEDEFKKLKQEIIDDLEEDYFAMRRPGFNIESRTLHYKVIFFKIL